MTVYIDPGFTPEDLRQALYEGDVVVVTGLESVADFVQYARAELRDLFKPHEPERAHEHLGKSEMASLLGSWKPRFIHARKSRELVCRIIWEAGFQVHSTYFDLPKPRTSFPADHLTTGIAYAFPWHRDMWYSAPRQQINWWLPVFRGRPDNCMSLDLQSFDRPVANSSGDFDYYANNAARLTTARQVSQESQVRPAALGYEPRHSLVVLPPPGAVMLFSGAQLHSSTPNTSGRARFSVDFRTVDVVDLEAGRGAPLVDVRCTGTAVRDFRRVLDGRPIDESAVVRLFGEPPAGSMLVFDPPPDEESNDTGEDGWPVASHALPEVPLG